MTRHRIKENKKWVMRSDTYFFQLYPSSNHSEKIFSLCFYNPVRLPGVEVLKGGDILPEYQVSIKNIRLLFLLLLYFNHIFLSSWIKLYNSFYHKMFNFSSSRKFFNICIFSSKGNSDIEKSSFPHSTILGRIFF